MIRLENGEREYLHRHIFHTEIRPLEDGEIVHHRNENKQDNSHGNLEACKDRAEHLREHDYWRRSNLASTYDSELGW